jgi:molybdate transport system substrate-binding protein
MARQLLRRAIFAGMASLYALLIGTSLALAAPAAAGPGAPAATSVPGEILVFAAASLTDALAQVDAAFTAGSGVKVKVSFAASSVLAKQIEAGAPADVFLSADLQWMDYLEEHGLLRAGTRHDLLGNALVLIAPADSTLQLQIAKGFNLAGALGGGRLSTGDPDSVPAGIYAKAALTQLGVWPSVADRLVRAENVRAALAYVARGETPLGIVYKTDAQAEKRVRVVGVFPADSHPPITYPVALTAGARPPAARYAEFLHSAAAHELFVRRGFTVLAEPRSP